MSRTIPRFVLFFDILWTLLALHMSYALHYGPSLPHSEGFYRLLAVASVGVWIALFYRIKLDCLNGGWHLHLALSKVATGTSFLLASILTFAYFVRLDYPRLMLASFAGLLFIGFLAIRIGTYIFLCCQQKRGRTNKVVLLGSERFILELNSKIRRHPELLYQVVGTLRRARTDDAGDADPFGSSNWALSSEDVLAALKERHVSEIIVLLDESPGLEFQSFIARCRTQGLAVRVLPLGYELYTSKPKLMHIDGFPLVALEERSIGPAAAIFKRVMDLVASLLLLPPIAFILTGSAIVLRSKKRRVFRRELRIGKNGRSFWMYRLDLNYGEANVPTYERFLLDLSISELPQLWNVLKGEMSLVGPRPECPNRVKNYSEWQRQRLKAKPGVTGLAQVNGLRDRHASEEKTRYDLQYLLDWTAFMDIVLLVQTLGALMRRLSPKHSISNLSSQMIENPNERTLRQGAVREMAHADRA